MNTNLTKNGAELLLEQLEANVYRWNITLDDSRYNQL